MADRRLIQPLDRRDRRRATPFGIFLQQNHHMLPSGTRSFYHHLCPPFNSPELIDDHICLNDQSVSQIPWRNEAHNHRPPAPRELESARQRVDNMETDFSDEEGTIILAMVGDYNVPGLRNDGFSEETVGDHLETRTHDESGNQETEICVVCQSEYEENESLGRLRCGHEYHSDCIRRWLLQRKFCPVCKRNA